MPSTLVSQLLVGGAGSLLGALATILGQNYLRNRQQRQSLRTALLTEMRSVEYVDGEGNSRNLLEEELEQLSESATISANPILDPEIYRNNADRLGILTTSEAEAVVEFYSSIIRGGDMAEVTKEIAVSDGMELPDDAAHRMGQQIYHAEQARKEAINEIQREMI